MESRSHFLLIHHQRRDGHKLLHNGSGRRQPGPFTAKVYSSVYSDGLNFLSLPIACPRRLFTICCPNVRFFVLKHSPGCSASHSELLPSPLSKSICPNHAHPSMTTPRRFTPSISSSPQLSRSRSVTRIPSWNAPGVTPSGRQRSSSSSIERLLVIAVESPADARRGESKKRPRNSRLSMPSGPILRGPSRKASGSWVYVVPALLGRTKHTCNMSSLLPLLIWFGVWLGLAVFHALRPDALLLFTSMMRLERVRQRYHF